MSVIFIFNNIKNEFIFFTDFLRSKFPYKLISNINKNNIDSFLSGWIDNRIRALIFDKKESVRLRYLFVAFYYRDRVAFGFVQVTFIFTFNMIIELFLFNFLINLIIIFLL